MRARVSPAESDDGLPPAGGAKHEVQTAKPDGHGGYTPCSCFVKQHVKSLQTQKFATAGKGKGELAITSNRDMVKMKGKMQYAARQSVGAAPTASAVSSQVCATPSSQGSVSSTVSDYSTHGGRVSQIAEHEVLMQTGLTDVAGQVKKLSRQTDTAKCEREGQLENQKDTLSLVNTKIMRLEQENAQKAAQIDEL